MESASTPVSSVLAGFDKDQVRKRLPLGFAALELGIRLDEQGRGLCPWHDDHRPSFGLYTALSGVEKFSCPVCGVSGDVFDLIRHHEGVGFTDAVARAREMLANLPERVVAPAPRQRSDFFLPAAESLVADAQARARGADGWVSVSLGIGDQPNPGLDEWLIDHWRIGVGPGGEGVFPHYTSAGVLTGVKFRGLSGDRWTFPGSRFVALYGSWHRRVSREVLLCEGETDALWASSVLCATDLVDVLALPSGAGKFILQWSELEADTYYLAFDGDAAGDAATIRWAEALEGRDVRVVDVPRDEDLKSWQPILRSALSNARGIR